MHRYENKAPGRMAEQQIHPATSSDTARNLPTQARLRRRTMARNVTVSLGLAIVLLLAADVLLLNRHEGRYTINVGTYQAGYFFTDIFAPESIGDSQAYRWTSPNTILLLQHVRTEPQQVLTLKLGGRPTPAPVALTLNGQPWVAFEAGTQPRTYTFALPPNPSDTLQIGIASAALTTSSDRRILGVKLHRVELVAPGNTVRIPPLATVLLQIALLGVILAFLLYLGWRARSYAAALALLSVGLALLLSGDLLLAYPYMLRLLCATIVLLGMSWVGLPLIMRLGDWAGSRPERMRLWTLMLLACAIRAAGMLYPTFTGQDKTLHLKLLREVTEGQLIHAVVASEFGRGLALYPPATYLALAPLRLIFPNELALLQGALALLDGFTALLVALLARRMGGNHYAARMALLLYAGSTTAFTAMNYGFSAQLFGQCLVAPVALALISHDPPLPRRSWLALALAMLFAVSSHVGVALLASVWVGLTLLLMLAWPHRNMLWGFGILVGCAIFAFFTLYIDGIDIMLSNFGQVGGGNAGGLFPGATPLLWAGMRRAYSDIGLALLPCGLALIAWAQRSRQAGIVAFTWVATVLLFLMIDLVLALQVRYFYFFLPMALAAIGVLLGALAMRGRWAYTVAWLAVLFVSIQGVTLWFWVTFGDGKLSLTPLTH